MHRCGNKFENKLQTKGSFQCFYYYQFDCVEQNKEKKREKKIEISKWYHT